MESEGGGGGFGGSGYVVRLKSREATRWACASSFCEAVRSTSADAVSWVASEGRVARVCCAVERMLVLRWRVNGVWFGDCEYWSIYGLLHGFLLRSEVLENVAKAFFFGWCLGQGVEAGDWVGDVGHHVRLVGRMGVAIVFLRDKLRVFDWVVFLKRC